MPPVADFNLLGTFIYIILISQIFYDLKGFLFVVATPLCSLGTWAVFQRNMKLAKWNDSLENLNVRYQVQF